MASTTRNFHHPYVPYDIQVQFMSNLYDCLDQRQVGIFESPTGTILDNEILLRSSKSFHGKSLSIICGALTWLRDHQLAELQGGAQSKGDDDEPAWVVEHAREERIKRALSAKRDLEARLARVRAEEQRKKKLLSRGEPSFKRLKTAESRHKSQDDEAEFLLDDYSSDKDDSGNGVPIANGGLSKETLKLLDRAGLIHEDDVGDSSPLEVPTKIFFCSRTHSQLTQFVNEVRRVKIKSPLQKGNLEEQEEEAESVRLLTLGARKNLCINPKVSRLKNSTAINERCLELQQPKTPKDSKCSFLPNTDNENLLIEFRDLALAQIRDIEDLGRIGKEVGVCPYYASRATLGPSEIVTLPYPLLLQKSARDALGISLKDQIVIIDEAHNLMDSIANIHSCSVNLDQLLQARSQLTVYLQKFKNRLKGKNRVYVAQIVRLIDSLIVLLRQHSVKGSSKGGYVAIQEIMSGKGLDQVNLHKLCQYLQESKLARKVSAYTHFSAENNQDGYKTATTTPETPVLMVMESLFLALTNPAKDGRFIWDKEDESYVLKYMLLDPAYHFSQVVEEARSVVLAGGTMSPMEDYDEHLFPYLAEGSIRKLSCGHVIPKENLLASALSGSAHHKLQFDFNSRSLSATMTELGKSILTLVGAIPDGVVVFFPSYSYMEQLAKYWKQVQVANGRTVYDAIADVKPIFQEQKGINTESLVAEYSNAITSGRGGLLLSVIGGKLSEGINFSDRLGRGVIVVGLPFPNPQSIEWKSKSEYIKQSKIEAGFTPTEGDLAAQEFSLNACMRAVNQSIGRAIRHRNDYACIVLLDARYRRSKVQEKLPGWIKGGFATSGDETSQTTDNLVPNIRAFFKRHGA